MKNKIICSIITMIFIGLPFLAMADGGVIRPLPNGDWVWVDENSQQAFINYEEGTEKLLVAVDIEEGNSDIAWLIPVPSNPEKVDIDITSELPIFFGDEVMSKTKIKLSEALAASYYAGLLGQIWTFPFFLVSFPGATGGGGGEEMGSGDLVSIETHIEKAGMIAEVITAKNSQAIYNYFSQKGFNIKEGSISELNAYINKDYSFVVSWIASGVKNERVTGQRGIFISFPTSKIYYPLVLTSAYGEITIPITIRVLNHVKPEIFSEIKPFTKVNYFTERTRGFGGARGARCQSAVVQLRTVFTFYYNNYDRYPSSLQELEKIEGAKPLFQEMDKHCVSPPSYTSKNKDDFTMKVLIGSELYMFDSTGFADFIDEDVFDEKKLISPELEKFYAGKKPWQGRVDYTKISINAPAQLLKKDLYMENVSPLKVSFVLWAINNLAVVAVLFYLFIIGTLSFIAGGLTGLLCFHKFKKYAIIGLGNIFTLLGLFLVFHSVKKKKGEDTKYSRSGFIFSFSIIFVLLLVSLSSISLLWEKKGADIWLASFLSVIFFGFAGAIYYLIGFLLNKIGLKNRAVRIIPTIILFIIILIMFLIML